MGIFTGINYTPGINLQDGLTKLNESFKHLACSKEDRALILCWMLSSLVPGHVPPFPLLQLSGQACSGKTVAMKMMSTLIYGDENLSSPDAVGVTWRTGKPVLFLEDNGNKMSRDIVEYLILSSDGCLKQQILKLPSLCCFASIRQPIPEIQARSFKVDFDRHQYGSDDFSEQQTLMKIKEDRDLILSAIQDDLSVVVPALHVETKLFSNALRHEYIGHTKEWLNHSFGLMFSLLAILREFLPEYDFNPFDAWITKGFIDV